MLTIEGAAGEWEIIIPIENASDLGDLGRPLQGILQIHTDPLTRRERLHNIGAEQRLSVVDLEARHLTVAELQLPLLLEVRPPMQQVERHYMEAPMPLLYV